MAEWGEDFEAFLAVELPRLLRLGYALTGNRHDAWDLAQETLITTGMHWGRVRRKGAAGAYARTTLVRLNIRRWHKREREVLGDVPDTTANGSLDTIPGLSPDVTAALYSLGPRQRSTVVLRHLYDMSLTQIAVEMDCSLGTVKSQLSRAESRLRERLTPGSETVAGPAASTREGAPDA
jgi:RNA polymerase sigma-70 factor (sigma-E family)